MAKDILKEAIADAKAVREVALANAKAALEEAFTPKIQSMLSAKLSEDLSEEMYDEDESDMDETYYDEDDKLYFEEDEIDEDEVEEYSMDEEINLEDILNELELEEGEAEEDDKKESISKPTEVIEGERFDLDALLREINEAEDNEEILEVEDDEEPLVDEEIVEAHGMSNMMPHHTLKHHTMGKMEEDDVAQYTATMNMDEYMMDEDMNEGHCAEGMYMTAEGHCMEGTRPGMPMGGPVPDDRMMENKGCGCTKENAELQETRSALKTVRAELNEINLLNSKLLYVNRIFKANTLDESQKLRVVETLDKAESSKEAKLIYETIKDTFNVANTKKESKKTTRSLREGLGMASKAAGTSTAPKKEIITESDNMVSRFQKLANIKID